jgi:hypothetical protein
MPGSSRSTFGIYPDQAAVEQAVSALKQSGFRGTDVSVLVPDNVGTKDFAHQKNTKAPEGAVAGGSIGALLGGGLGFLGGMGLMMVPGLEQVAVAGPVLGTLSGLGLGIPLGAITGAVAGATVPEYEAKRFEGRIRGGAILLSVHCDNPNWAKTAATVLKRTGATNIGTAGEAKADFAISEKPKPR